ncbi:uncharacterized protein LOC129317294 [Prosopis cineraria]|uniref:uncharacterized protein LOC129317294 n=1 Tax=Prosopis cineraria TaxID=364024 RepID=UPI00240EABEA|nr:uncharacterized protein LOC129317294 [Prosopis cineraria]
MSNMDVSFSDDEFSFISAVTSVGGASRSLEELMFFYSVPTSPSFIRTSSLYGSDLDAEDEFEFETSRRFLDPRNLETDQKKDDDEEENDEKQKQRLQRKSEDSLPTMSFADELFCDGKVLPLPLKLPPRLQNGSARKASMLSSSASLSPRSLGSSVKRTLSGKCLWNDDFDPFMVALKVVREEEERGKPKERDGIRRTKSELLIRSKGPNGGPSGLACEGPNEPLIAASRGPKMVFSEPKGLELARKTRLIGLDKNGPNRNKAESESGGAWKEKRKREKIMKFLFGKVSGYHKFRDQKDETVCEVKKMTMTCYKPRLLLCLGYGGRYVK